MGPFRVYGALYCMYNYKNNKFALGSHNVTRVPNFTQICLMVPELKHLDGQTYTCVLQGLYINLLVRSAHFYESSTRVQGTPYTRPLPN